MSVQDLVNGFSSSTGGGSKYGGERQLYRQFYRLLSEEDRVGLRSAVLDYGETVAALHAGLPSRPWTLFYSDDRGDEVLKAPRLKSVWSRRDSAASLAARYHEVSSCCAENTVPCVWIRTEDAGSLVVHGLDPDWVMEACRPRLLELEDGDRPQEAYMVLPHDRRGGRLWIHRPSGFVRLAALSLWDTGRM